MKDDETSKQNFIHTRGNRRAHYDGPGVVGAAGSNIAYMDTSVNFENVSEPRQFSVITSPSRPPIDGYWPDVEPYNH